MVVLGRGFGCHTRKQKQHSDTGYVTGRTVARRFPEADRVANRRVGSYSLRLVAGISCTYNNNYHKMK
jgi:hypothetical protein